MALLKCIECKKQVSEAAEACPNCGNPIDDLALEAMKEIAEKEKKQQNVAAIGCGVLLVLLVGVCAVGGNSSSEKPKSRSETRKERIEKHFSAWDGSHRGLTKRIKESMNDPSSYEHVETRYGDKGDYLIVRTTFRGKNAFGGKVLNTCTAKVDLDGNVLQVLSMGP